MEIKYATFNLKGYLDVYKCEEIVPGFFSYPRIRQRMNKRQAKNTNNNKTSLNEVLIIEEEKERESDFSFARNDCSLASLYFGFKPKSEERRD